MNSIHTQTRLFLVLCFLAILLACRPANVWSAQAETGPIAEVCERWHKHHRFDDLRSCILSVAHNGTPKAKVVAMLGPGQRVTLAHTVWEPPKEAYSYTPVDRENFHYVVVYRDDVVVELCCYSLDSEGRPSVILG
jgi:hypothetical protein